MLERFLDASPYVAVLLALLAGSLGAPLPEEIPIVTAGILAHGGYVRWWLMLPVCLAGVVSGDLILYGAGRRWGDRLLTHPRMARILAPERRARFTELYQRYGTAIVLAARHVMGLRAAAFLTAGMVGLPFWRFLLADGIAIVVGVSLNFTLAFIFAERVWAVLADVGRVERWIGAALVAAVLVWLGVAVHRRSLRILQERRP
ncbi:MAG TPA: DedA family protein [Methylomirabilota bacterium]|nr:DedA family protein [Methylomirabilota bacterium]